jgi:hypothetical protein
MPPKKAGPAPSRRGKRQLVVFLDPSFAGPVRARALREGKTVQEMLASGMNAILARNGYRKIFPVGHQRYLRRKQRVAVPRKTATTTLARRGLASISGWFDTKCLDYANSAACELGLTLQELAEEGLRLLMQQQQQEEEQTAPQDMQIAAPEEESVGHDNSPASLADHAGRTAPGVKPVRRSMRRPPMDLTFYMIEREKGEMPPSHFDKFDVS